MRYKQYSAIRPKPVVGMDGELVGEEFGKGCSRSIWLQSRDQVCVYMCSCVLTIALVLLL